LKRFLAAVAAVLIGIFLVRVRFQSDSRNAHGVEIPKQPPSPAEPVRIPNESSVAAPLRSPGEAKDARSELPASSSATVLAVPGLPPVTLHTGETPGEAIIAAITRRTDLSEKLKARLLFQMLPGLPEAVVAQAAEEIVRRVTDSDYRELLLPALLDAKTHGMAMSVLFADLMQRPEPVALPILLSIAKNPGHPYSPYARENLEHILGQDPGAGWTRWEEGIRERVAAPGK
jgi:hypothetical protein